jgi:SAM-dependent methyltransferase
MNRRRASRLNVSMKVHPLDFIYRFLVSHPDLEDPLRYYLEDGRTSAELLRQLLKEQTPWLLDRPFDLLEFASGYGMVSRHLVNTLPNAALVASDLHPQAVEFIQHTLGIRAQRSTSIPAQLRLGQQFDVVFVLSLFSHLPESTWSDWLCVLYEHVAPGGLFVFTTHGDASRQKEMGHVTMPARGFLFLPGSEQLDIDANEYGTTITTRAFVEETIASVLPPCNHSCKEAFWWGHQDVYLIHKE